jgi:hypothetical protein
MIPFSSVLIFGPLLQPVRLGPKRTSRFVIFLSLAVFDRVKAEGLAASAESDARKAPDLAPHPRLRVT